MCCSSYMRKILTHELQFFDNWCIVWGCTEPYPILLPNFLESTMPEVNKLNCF